jgi:hypothetical protein
MNSLHVTVAEHYHKHNKYLTVQKRKCENNLHFYFEKQQLFYTAKYNNEWNSYKKQTTVQLLVQIKASRLR